MGKRLAVGFLGLLLAGITFEISCQLYTLSLAKRWEKTRTAPGHYFSASPNSTLTYELAQNFRIEQDGRLLSINRYGIRELDDQISSKSKVAILGDSVAFGIGLSQEETISSLLQRELEKTDTDTKVLNFGVPGYALRELVEHLKVTNRIYDVDRVFYVLNPNDFARRDSVYEGADAGLYRMYKRPLLKSPWFIRKTIYRLHKYDSVEDYRRYKASAGWYEWLYRGGRAAAQSDILEMASYAGQRAISLTVVLLPAGVAYDRDGAYGLTGMHNDIGTFLETHDIDHLDPADQFGSDVERYFDPTDHLTTDGNALMSTILADHLDQQRNGPVDPSLLRSAS